MPETIEINYLFFLALCLFAGMGVGTVTGTIHQLLRK